MRPVTEPEEPPAKRLKTQGANEGGDEESPAAPEGPARKEDTETVERQNTTTRSLDLSSQAHSEVPSTQEQRETEAQILESVSATFGNQTASADESMYSFQEHLKALAEDSSRGRTESNNVTNSTDHHAEEVETSIANHHTSNTGIAAEQTAESATDSSKVLMTNSNPTETTGEFRNASELSETADGTQGPDRESSAQLNDDREPESLIHETISNTQNAMDFLKELESVETHSSLIDPSIHATSALSSDSPQNNFPEGSSTQPPQPTFQQATDKEIGNLHDKQQSPQQSVSGPLMVEDGDHSLSENNNAIPRLEHEGPSNEIAEAPSHMETSRQIGQDTESLAHSASILRSSATALENDTPSLSTRFSAAPHFNSLPPRIKLKLNSLGTLDNLATQVLRKLTTGLYQQILDLVSSPDTEDGQCFQISLTLFESCKRIYSDDPFLFPNDILIYYENSDMSDSGDNSSQTAKQVFYELGTSLMEELEIVLRKANLATFLLATFGCVEVGFFYLNEYFFHVFVPSVIETTLYLNPTNSIFISNSGEMNIPASTNLAKSGTTGFRLLKKQAALYLDLKTQAFISAMQQRERPREEILDDLFPESLAQEILALKTHPLASQIPDVLQGLSSTELDFVNRCKARREYLTKSCLDINEEPDQNDSEASGSGRKMAPEELAEKYDWLMFLRELCEYVGRSLDGIIFRRNGPTVSVSAETVRHDVRPEVEAPSTIVVDAGEPEDGPSRITSALVAAAQENSSRLQSVVRGEGESDKLPERTANSATGSDSNAGSSDEQLKGNKLAVGTTSVAELGLNLRSILANSGYKVSNPWWTTTPRVEDNGEGMASDATAGRPSSEERQRRETSESDTERRSSGSTKGPPKPRPMAQRRLWTREEEVALRQGLDMVKGPYWSQILELFGAGGRISEVLKDRTQVQLKDKARNWKLFFMKNGLEVPNYLKFVTGDLYREKKKKTVESIVRSGVRE